MTRGKERIGGCDQRIRRTTTDGDGLVDGWGFGVWQVYVQKKMQTRKAADENHDDENNDQDPFEMFGPITIEDVDYDNSNNRLQDMQQQQQQQQQKRQQQRDPANGFNSFHRGTEQALIQYVRNKLDESIAIDDCSKTKAVDYAIRFVDEFCLERHWMMHIGVSCVCCVVFYVCICYML